jgi:hypothetical protein
MGHGSGQGLVRNPRDPKDAAQAFIEEDRRLQTAGLVASHPQASARTGSDQEAPVVLTFPQEHLQLFHPDLHRMKRSLGRVVISVSTAVMLTAGGAATVVDAAPGTVDRPVAVASQNVDWMSADTASLLDLGFNVMVPTYIPGPFTGAPSISASGGYYSLYWFTGGGSPTFLQITGSVGGSLPEGSPADLNNELTINANVQGYDAIHDLTAIYDAVWWIAGGVLYEVNAQGLSVDSLTLANSLVTLVPPQPEPTEVPPEPTQAPPEPTVAPTTPPETNPTVTPDSGAGAVDESETPGATVTPVPAEGETPEASGGQTAEPTVAPTTTPVPTVVSAAGVLSAPGTVLAGDSIFITVASADGADLLASGGVFSSVGSNGIVNVQDGSIAWRAPLADTELTVTFDLLVSATGEDIDTITITVVPRTTGDPFRGSDGTEGPPHPLTGSDGTGGTQQLTLPVPTPVP